MARKYTRLPLTDEQRAAKRERDNRYYASAKGIENRMRKVMESQGQMYGTRNSMGSVGLQPQHTRHGMPDAEAIATARARSKVQGSPTWTYAPTPSINPPDPRTRAVSYYQDTQILMVEWGDGGVPYAYYDVTPQVADGIRDVESPGKYINAVLNSHNYGPIGQRQWLSGDRAGQRRTDY